MSHRFRAGLAVVVASVVLFAGEARAQRACSGISEVSHTGLTKALVASGLNRPVLVLSAPGDTNQIFIVEQNGTIRVLPRGAAPTEHTVFMDISDRVSTVGNEMGLLGMAFGQQFGFNGQFYLSYTTLVSGVIRSTIRRFNLDPTNPAIGDPDSEHEIITFRQPGFETNHNGGHIAFGSDSYLYMSIGDGGGGNDLHGTCGNGQDTTNILGTIVRIDPLIRSEASPECAESGNYSIPVDNPLADGPGGVCDEIWSYGLRNPWRFSFDEATDDMYIADVGQNCWEEINYRAAAVSGGENFGWRSMEGLHCFNPASPFSCDPLAATCADAVPCGDPDLVAPIAEYDHGAGCSISGGFVYRGCQLPDLAGTYFYGDYCTGFVRSFRVVGGAVTDAQDHPTLGIPFGISGFGTDARGELYILDHIADQVFKILPLLSDVEVSGPGTAFDFKLDKTGEWTWEDLNFVTGHPVDEYHVYRRDSGATEFVCIHTSEEPNWPLGGDTTEPGAGQLISYLVTAAAGGEETSPGHADRVLVFDCPL